MKKLFFIVVIIAVIMYFCFSTLLFLPKGELIKTCDNPITGHTVNVFLYNPGAIGDYCIRCEIVYKSKIKRNIYWNNHCEDAEIIWIDDSTVRINNQDLNIYTDIYDWRDNI